MRIGCFPNPLYRRRLHDNVSKFAYILYRQLRKVHLVTVLKLFTLLCVLVGLIISTIVWGKKLYKIRLTAAIDTFSIDEKYSRDMLGKVPLRDRNLNSQIDSVFESGCRNTIEESKKPRENAAFVVLARNSELDEVIDSMNSLERHFNQWFNYPWVFLNDEQFTKEFKDAVRKASSGKVEFGMVEPTVWHMPMETKNPTYFAEAVEEQGDRGIMYGSMAAYHRMCRFYSGFFFHHKLVQKYEWYWRVEPGVDFYCDITYDPFREMRMHGKKYGFTIMIKELRDTVPNLFRYTLTYARMKNISLPDSWRLFSDSMDKIEGANRDQYEDVRDLNQFWQRLQQRAPVLFASKWSSNKDPKKKVNNLSDHTLTVLAEHSGEDNTFPEIAKDKFDKQEYNLCHFWSNFEIGKVDFFLSPQYKDYYNFLEDSNGFFMERWGDAPIHSLALGLFANQSEIHYFRDIGYRHSTLQHCPKNSPLQLKYVASDKYKKSYSAEEEKYWLDYDKPAKDIGSGVGCRCSCPEGYSDIEVSGSSCIPQWARLTDDHRGPSEILDLDRIEDEVARMYGKYVTRYPNRGDRWALSAKDCKKLQKYVLLQ